MQVCVLINRANMQKSADSLNWSHIHGNNLKSLKNSTNVRVIIIEDSTCLKARETSFRDLQLRKLNKKYPWGLPWWRSGWESACQCRGHGFEPWSGKIPHAAEQLGPWATITEPARLEPVLRDRRGCNSERPAHRDEEWPPLATTRESPRTETKTQHSHK